MRFWDWSQSPKICVVVPIPQITSFVIPEQHFLSSGIWSQNQKLLSLGSGDHQELLWKVYNQYYNVIYFQKHTGKDKVPLVLYHACIDPNSNFSISLLSVYPVHQIILYGMNIINISCDFYLYFFLEETTSKTTSTSNYIQGH